jgi:hypothetical protein
VLAVVALAVAAATVDSAVVVEGGGSAGLGGGDVGGAGPDSSGDLGVTSFVGGPVVPPAICIRWLNHPLVIVGVVGVFLLGGVVAYRRTGSVLPPLTLWISFGLPLYLVHSILTVCGPTGGQFSVGGGGAQPNVSVAPGGGAGGFGGGAGSAVPVPTALLALLLAAALSVSVILLFVSTADESAPEFEEGDPEEDQPDVAAVARTAGEAADRIEADADTDNEVYRAWVEMTRHLAVEHPQSSTPAEFAAAAVDAGMARGDVEELTDLFEAVRYGGEPATRERESRAVAALRRIEATYADADSDTDGDGTDPDGTGRNGSGSGSGSPGGDPWR